MHMDRRADVSVSEAADLPGFHKQQSLEVTQNSTE